ncbi:beta-ketoacyl synthase N-terminal-like domain-containing protein [Stieleria varia]|uniref:3-oxoacyl-[acyl-carrier-protein] synthase 2 n=1 Tax=Stieleria varia TaxID=2528005 RepID=A0A5C6AP79_9BACT|nr:beta-ketoacyl synthase N-terminal-like domain-containing protein [Stieleria varia]TWU01079.1 3-oxoacyl-[acyl-carrier-protein] synthase 2 [Stieleria varia]
MSPNPIMITGVGVVSSIGIGRKAFFEGLLNKKSGICWLSERTDDDAKPDVDNMEPKGIWVGGPILDFDAKEFVRPRKALKVMCREIQLSFAASMLAIDDAGLTDAFPAAEDGVITPDRVGTVFGGEMFFGPPQEMVDSIQACLAEGDQINTSVFGMAAKKNLMPLWMLKYLPNMPACHVGISVNAHGPNNSLVLGDVSGPAAIMESISCLQRGIADVILSGSIGNRLNTSRMTCRYDSPIPEVNGEVKWASRPHDPDATGVVGGEAAVTLVLESSDHAKQRGVKPLATILSSASRFVASEAIQHGERSGELNPPFHRGSSKAIRLAISGALTQANRVAADIGLVVSHAMGDPMMDSAERIALSELEITAPLVAPIAALGHTGAASGGIAVATGALALANGMIPPTVGVEPAPQETSSESNSAPHRCGLRSTAEPLRSPLVLCLASTAEGSATAILLGDSAR